MRGQAPLAGDRLVRCLEHDEVDTGAGEPGRPWCCWDAAADTLDGSQGLVTAIARVNTSGGRLLRSDGSATPVAPPAQLAAVATAAAAPTLSPSTAASSPRAHSSTSPSRSGRPPTRAVAGRGTRTERTAGLTRVPG